MSECRIEVVSVLFLNLDIFCFEFFQGWFDRAKVGVERLVEKVGFFGILACASVSEKIS